MIVQELVRTAFGSLKANPMRSFLTMLGVIIGVAAVITMVALGQGAKEEVESRLQALGTNRLTIFPGRAHFRGRSVGTMKMTFDDMNKVLEEVAEVTAVAPVIRGNGQLKHLNINVQSQVVGTTPNYPLLSGSAVDYGSFFTNAEMATRKRVIVLGNSVATELFPIKDPLDEKVKINGQIYSVIGVMAPMGQVGWSNPDDQVFSPYSTARFRLFGREDLSYAIIEIANETLIDRAIIGVERVLRKEHRLRPHDENDFTIRSQLDIIGTYEETTRTFSFLLAAIASVSLLVGGIGIMNIMLVSVTERTREIGIRKAIGAKSKDILLQFLVESLTLSLFGGIVGIIGGTVVSELLSSLARWNTTISVQAVAISFAFAAGVAIFFGVYPAKKAAGLDPVEALRYE
jgi:putative ABC transport system permease protein